MEEPRLFAHAVAVATLAVAAAFQPARRRIQQVDRIQQVNLDTLTAGLLAVVEQTMQPTQVALWLRPCGNRPARP